MAMGSAGKSTLIALLMIGVLFIQNSSATTFTVGGTTGWTLGIGPTFYDDWAKSHTFVEGDTLDFPYVGASHNVFEVSKADLASCNLATPLKTYETTGGASIPLTTAGNHYYICGIPGHCSGNMKLSIVVSAAALPPAASTPTSAPAPSKEAPAPSKKAPAPSKKAPAPSKKHLPPTPTPAISVKAPAPAPSLATSKGHQSAVSAALVGAILCVVTSLLFQ